MPVIGYIYCMSNESMPGIYKVGMTTRHPDARLLEANMSDTWRPPTPYRLEFYKRVYNPREKESEVHKLLTIHYERINQNREFFKVPLDNLKTHFDLLDKKMWFDEE